MKNGSVVAIRVNGIGLGSVAVDGVEIPRVQSVTTHVTAGEVPTVTLTMGISNYSVVEYEGASIHIDGLALPASVELALWKHLAAKYGREVDVTVMNSVAREYVLRDN